MDRHANEAAHRPPDDTAEPEGFMVMDASGDRIHFLDWGGSESAAGTASGAVLVHGLSTTAWIWAPVARRLRGACHVVAMDLRGHGLSDAPTDDGAYRSEAFGEDVVAVAEGARLVPMPGLEAAPATPSSVVLAGHGFGAIVAAWGAAQLGDRCAGLVLVDGGWESLAETTGQDPDGFLRTVEEPPEVLESMTAFLADRAAFDPPTWDADQERAARASVVELPVGRIVGSARPHAVEASVRTMFEYDPVETLAAVKAPIVVLQAADDEDGTHGRALDRLQAGLGGRGRPPVAVTHFPGDGHNLMRYRPDEVTAAILELARRAAAPDRTAAGT